MQWCVRRGGGAVIETSASYMSTLSSINTALTHTQTQWTSTEMTATLPAKPFR